jgi:hypothetical protein
MICPLRQRANSPLIGVSVAQLFATSFASLDLLIKSLAGLPHWTFSIA